MIRLDIRDFARELSDSIARDLRNPETDAAVERAVQRGRHVVAGLLIEDLKRGMKGLPGPVFFPNTLALLKDLAQAEATDRVWGLGQDTGGSLEEQSTRKIGWPEVVNSLIKAAGSIYETKMKLRAEERMARELPGPEILIPEIERTPVRPTERRADRGFPWIPVILGAGVLGLVVYLVVGRSK